MQCSLKCHSYIYTYGSLLFLLQCQSPVGAIGLDKRGIKCTLRCKPGNFAVLGPLFGPYRILVDRTNHDDKEIRGQKVERTLNVRLHKDCAFWAPGFVGSDLIGTGRVLSNASKKNTIA